MFVCCCYCFFVTSYFIVVVVVVVFVVVVVWFDLFVDTVSGNKGGTGGNGGIEGSPTATGGLAVGVSKQQQTTTATT